MIPALCRGTMANESTQYEVSRVEGGVPVKRWTRGVAVEPAALTQLENVSRLPFVGPWVACMPDMHVGKGATIGSVIPTTGAVIPAAVGVDLGCGMMAVKTSLMAKDLPDNLAAMRSAIERAVPHGRSAHRPRHRHRRQPPAPDPILRKEWRKGRARWSEIHAAGAELHGLPGRRRSGRLE